MRCTLALWLLFGTLLLISATSLGQTVPPIEQPAPSKPPPYKVSLEGLMDAIHDKDVRAVARLLARGVKVNVSKQDNLTPLRWAVSYRQSAIVQLLLERGADITMRDLEGRTALHYAIYHEKPEILKLLLEHGPRNSVHLQDNEKWTPLHLAAREGRVENMRLLLEHGADPNARGDFRQTPLMEAVRGGSVESIRLLLAWGADPDLQDTSGGTALMLVADETKEEDRWSVEPASELLRNMTQALLLRANVRNEQGCRALRMAVESGQDAVADLLLKAGAPAKGVQEARFLLAAERGDRATVERLLAEGVPVDVVSRHGYTALMSAAMNGYPSLVDLLLSKGAAVNVRNRLGETPLLCAIDDPQIVKTLLEKGADVNARVLYGKTTLMYAPNNLPLARLLLDAGANIHLKDKDGATAFVHAMRRNAEVEFLRMLLDRGMRLNTPQRGMTPLMWAANYQRPEALVLLLERGANVRAKDGEGNTALHHAIHQHSAPVRMRFILEALLNRDADINARNKAGETPLSLALKKENRLSEADLAFLRARGAIDGSRKREVPR
jgi:uncharacterized protein